MLLLNAGLTAIKAARREDRFAITNRLSLSSLQLHSDYMQAALALAHRAFKADEVPVGAVVVLDGKIIGKGYNQSIRKSDPMAHAEILALRQAAKRIGNYRLTSATLYTTLEPCCMCAGALILARVKLLVYGAKDNKTGAVHSHLNLLDAAFLNHRVEIIAGVMEEESGELLREFFRLKRMKG